VRIVERVGAHRGDAIAPVDLSASPWMMTLNVWEGFALADARSPGVV